MSSICIAKATHIFCSKNINVFENTLAITVNEFVINELVKLTMLSSTGPSTFWLKKKALSGVMCVDLINSIEVICSPLILR